MFEELTRRVQDLRDTLCTLGFSSLAPKAEVEPLFPRIQFDPNNPETDEYWVATGGSDKGDLFATRIKTVFDSVWQQAEGHDCT